MASYLLLLLDRYRSSYLDRAWIDLRGANVRGRFFAAMFGFNRVPSLLDGRLADILVTFDYQAGHQTGICECANVGKRFR